MELDERKTKILNVIIKNYLETGEPVGSRTISKDPELSLSSATIRNEMSDLEEMGYIVQPHTSAGRIPTDKGYRFYVDNMVVKQDREIKEVKDMMIERTDKLEALLMQAVKTLADNTNYTTMISAPALSGSKIKFIQLSSVDMSHVLAVIVLDGNRVKNEMITVGEPVDSEDLMKLNFMLNASLNGLSVEQINLATIAQLKEQAGIHSGVVSDVLDIVAEAIHEDDDLKVYTSGKTNIFKYPELSNGERASELLNTLEEKEGLASLITDSLESETGLQIYIGDETPVASLKDCSVVTATYDFGDNVKGMIGIVGPKRMDYENVVDNLNTVRSKLDEVFRKE
ncbi:MAG: heat-inducible transcriptional repressor HrcA [Eubacterium sp.]|nr:heat-inducible transcriptional repressor HrcA [Eubacterium sp.]